MPTQKKSPVLLTISEAASFGNTTKQNLWRAIQCGRLTLASSAFPARVAKESLDEYFATKGS